MLVNSHNNFPAYLQEGVMMCGEGHAAYIPAPYRNGDGGGNSICPVCRRLDEQQQQKK